MLKRVELSGDASKSSFFASAKFCLTWEKEWPNFHPEAMKVVKKLAHYCFFRQLGLLSNFNVIHRRLRPNGLVVCLLASIWLWSFFFGSLAPNYLMFGQKSINSKERFVHIPPGWQNWGWLSVPKKKLSKNVCNKKRCPKLVFSMNVIFIKIFLPLTIDLESHL